MNVFSMVFLGASLVYSFLIFSWIIKLLRLNGENGNLEATNGKKYDLSFSIVCVFRNEEKNLKKLINCLSNQKNNDPKSLNLTFFNDGSMDGSLEYLESQIFKFKSLRIIDIPQGLIGSPKRWAQKSLGENLHYDYFLFTDADCFPNENWIGGILKKISTDRPDFIGGVIHRNAKGVRGWIEQPESLILAIMTLFSLKARSGLLANGGNLCVSRRVLQSNYIADRVDKISGDDIDLLKAAINLPSSKISSIWQKGSQVETIESGSFKDFFFQKVRWSGKWRMEGWHSVLAIFLFCYFLLCCMAIVLSLTSSNEYILLGLGLKVFFDSLLFIVASKKMKWGLRIWPFIFSELVYPIYFLFFGFFSRFIPFYWKDRKYHGIK